MKNLITKTKQYGLLVAIVVIIALVAYYFIWYGKNGTQNDTLTIKASDFLQTVSVSGKVIPSQSADLGFSRSGNISNVNVVVGQNVSAGQVIAEIDSRNAALAVESAKIELARMTENSNPNGSSGLDKDSEDSLNNINQVFSELPAVINGLDDVLTNYRVSPYLSNLPNDTANNYYKTAQASYDKAKNNYESVLLEYKGITQPVSKATVKILTEDTYQMLQGLTQSAKNANLYINYVYDYYTKTNGAVTDPQIPTDRTRINTWLQTVNGSLSTITASRNTLKNSGFSIEAQRLLVQQKEHDYADCFLRAPFSGVITRLDIKTGEQAIAGQATVTLINSGLFQIESFVPEINIANLRVGNPAQITLDAYGSEVPFEAKIISIDPAETIRDGVSTYKVKLQFAKTDARIKSGMTANLILTTENKQNVISVPPSAIITSGEQKFIQTKSGNQLTKQLITIGSIGALGQTEVLSGLKEGDIVIVNPKTN